MMHVKENNVCPFVRYDKFAELSRCLKSYEVVLRNC